MVPATSLGWVPRQKDSSLKSCSSCGPYCGWKVCVFCDICAAPTVLSSVTKCNFMELNNCLLRKTTTKLIQRIGLIFLKHRVAAWRSATYETFLLIWFWKCCGHFLVESIDESRSYLYRDRYLICNAQSAMKGMSYQGKYMYRDLQDWRSRKSIHNKS